MRRRRKLLIALAVLLLLLGVGAAWFLAGGDEREPSRVAYGEYCAGCHGVALEGAEGGPPLVGRPLPRGETTDALIASILETHPGQDIEAWRQSISEYSIKALAMYIGERRRDWPTTGQSYALGFEEQVVDSRHHRFRST